MINFGVLVFALNRIDNLKYLSEVLNDTCYFWLHGEEYEMKYFWLSGEEYLKITLKNTTNIWRQLTAEYNPPEADVKICISGRTVEEIAEDVKTALTQLKTQRAIDVFDIYSDICLGFKKIEFKQGMRR